MAWHDKIIAAHLAVTDQVSHSEHLQSDRYFVWQEENQNDLVVDNRHGESIVTGTTDFFTKMEFDPWKEAFEAALNDDPYIAWNLESVQYEEETGLYHYEWLWRVV